MPVKVIGLPSGVTALAAAYLDVCAVVGSTGAVYCWGQNQDGQLGNGGPGAMATSAIQVPGIANASAVATGDSTCALVAQKMMCWGSTANSELAQPASNVIATPTTVTNLGSVQQMAVGRGSTCALVSGGIVYCWGSNLQGILGNPATAIGAQTAVPVPVNGLSSGASQIVAGNGMNCAVLVDGAGWCWGSEQNGRLGNGVASNDAYSASPVRVSGISGVASIASATEHSCALLSNGSVSCWGFGGAGELGNGISSSSSVPVPVKGW